MDDFSSPLELLEVPRDNFSNVPCKLFIFRLTGFVRSMVVTCMTEELLFRAMSLSNTANRIANKVCLRVD